MPPRNAPTSDAPDPARVEAGRLKCVTWLINASSQNTLHPDFDPPDEPIPCGEVGPIPPYWWAGRRKALVAYTERAVRGRTPATPLGGSLAPVTVYLLAEEALAGGSRGEAALARLRLLRDAVAVPSRVRRVAGAVAAGEIPSDPVEFGPLEWALLEACGVVWPRYAMPLAHLGESRTDELERDVGGRLASALDDFVPAVHGRPQSARAVLWWIRVWLESQPPRLRAFLLDAARQAVEAEARSVAQRREAVLAILGLSILEATEIWRESPQEALRAAASSRGEASEHGRALARRLLRFPTDAPGREVREEYWRCVETAELASTPTPEAPRQPRAPKRSGKRPTLDLDGVGIITVDGVSSGISADSGPGHLLRAILLSKPWAGSRRADRTELNKGLRSASDGRLELARAAGRDGVRRLGIPVAVGSSLQERWHVGPQHPPAR